MYTFHCDLQGPRLMPASSGTSDMYHPLPGHLEHVLTVPLPAYPSCCSWKGRLLFQVSAWRPPPQAVPGYSNKSVPLSPPTWRWSQSIPVRLIHCFTCLISILCMRASALWGRTLSVIIHYSVPIVPRRELYFLAWSVHLVNVWMSTDWVGGPRWWAHVLAELLYQPAVVSCPRREAKACPQTEPTIASFLSSHVFQDIEEIK